jgi:hypothetical protein
MPGFRKTRPFFCQVCGQASEVKPLAREVHSRAIIYTFRCPACRSTAERWYQRNTNEHNQSVRV